MTDNIKDPLAANKAADKEPLETKETITPPVEPKKYKETVEVPKDLFEAMEKRLKRLEETANKGRLSNYDNAHADDKITIIKLRTIDGRVITHWSNMVSNKAEVDPVTKKIVEDQKVEIFYEDGTSEKMDLVVFNRRYNYIKTVLKEDITLRKQEDIDKYGDRKLVLETDDGKEYTIGVKFVN